MTFRKTISYFLETSKIIVVLNKVRPVSNKNNELRQSKQSPVTINGPFCFNSSFKMKVIKAGAQPSDPHGSTCTLSILPDAAV